MTREDAIESLLKKVEEVISNNDWPTTDGTWVETATTCTCPINELVKFIREGKQ
jgi:hypothetical protein